MTTQTTQTPAPTPQTSGWTVTALATLQFVKEYFSVISALGILAGVTLATVFLYAYLSVFDWHLFWLVQYPDILTFALVAIGIVGGLTTFFGTVIEGILVHTGILSGKPNYVYIIALALVYAFGFALTIYLEHMTADPRYMHIVLAWSSVIAFVFAVVVFARIVHLGVHTSGWLVVWALLTLTSGTYIFGLWLGFSVLETGGYDQDVYLKSQTINQVKIVLVMSHHTILYKDRILFVIPTADVQQIVSTPQR